MDSIKVLVLAEARSVHTLKWLNALAIRNINFVLFSLFDPLPGQFPYDNDIEIISMGLSEELLNREIASIKKSVYFKTLPKVKKIIRRFKPDIIHAHFASSYGLIGALSRFHPFILSVWGSDIFYFPMRSLLHRKILKFNLKQADKILSTSQIMAKEIKKYIDKPVEVTPFGIDLNKFRPIKIDKKTDELVVGIVKGLEKIYGHNYLLEAFSIVKQSNPEKKLKLLIVGDGGEKKNLMQLAEELNISEFVQFAGRVDYAHIEKYHNKIDIAVYPSIIPESFGVSILEASACQKPVIVTRVGGLREVVREGETGLFVEPKNERKLAEAIQLLIDDEKRRIEMGIAGRAWVENKFNFDHNVEQMLRIYKETIQATH